MNTWIMWITLHAFEDRILEVVTTVVSYSVPEFGSHTPITNYIHTSDLQSVFLAIQLPAALSIIQPTAVTAQLLT